MKAIAVAPEEVAARIESLLHRHNASAAGLDLRGKVLLLCDILSATREFYKAVVTGAGCTAADARGRILYYMQQNVGTILNAQELEIVSGISDYGRRIRELRVEFGYRIVTADSLDPESGLVLRPNQYVLLRADPDRGAAHRWHIANDMRKQTGGAKARILAFLTANAGEVVTSAELQYVAKTSEFARRVRELRTEDGYPIKTMYTGRPDLGPGEYVLESTTRRTTPHDRTIEAAIEREVYARAENRCELCGWSRAEWHADDPRSLELHHVRAHAEGGPNTADNLRVVCSRCHDEIHAGRVSLDTQPGVHS